MQKFKLLSVSEIKEMLISMKVIPKSIRIFFHVSKWIFLLTVIVNIVAGIIPVISVNILGELINSMTAINLKNSLTILAVYLAVCFLVILFRVHKIISFLNFNIFWIMYY